MSKRGESLAELVELMQTLLGPNGCPWDREQTLESLRQYVIEEAHEVVDTGMRSFAGKLSAFRFHGTLHGGAGTGTGNITG